MLLLKDRGKAIQVLAPVKVTINQDPAAIGRGELIEIGNEIWSRTHTGCDSPDDENRGWTSVGEHLRSTAANLPEPKRAYAPSSARKG